MKFFKFTQIIELKKSCNTWNDAVTTYNKINGTACSKMDGTRAKKLDDFFIKISHRNEKKMRLYFSKNVIAITSFINVIPKIENYGIDKLINWIKSRISENPDIRLENYGQLNLKDYFKFIEKQ